MSGLTLRRHLETIRLRHQQNTWCEGLPGEKFCAWCEKTWPCADYADATMMLAILDDAERADTWFNGESQEHLRLVPDPEPLSHGEMPA